MIRKTLSTIAAAVAAVGLLAVAAPAHAEDTRPCVSKREFYGTAPGGDHAPWPRAYIEARWDVTGLGHIDPDYGVANANMWVYPACGYAPGEGEIWAYFGKKAPEIYYGGFRFISGPLHGNP